MIKIDINLIFDHFSFKYLLINSFNCKSIFRNRNFRNRTFSKQEFSKREFSILEIFETGISKQEFSKQVFSKQEFSKWNAMVLWMFIIKRIKS